MFRKSFLGEAWKKSKLAFFICCVFILGNLITHITKIEITPFFLWGHYSAKQDPQESYERIYVKVNGDLIDLSSTQRSTREMIQLPVEHYLFLESQGFDTWASRMLTRACTYVMPDSTASNLGNRLNFGIDKQGEFLSWLSRYISDVYSLDVETLELGTFDAIISGTETYKTNFRQHAYYEVK